MPSPALSGRVRGVETVRIVAVTPPGSMRRVIADLRKELYVRWGCVSALALPPIVPLCAWPLRLGPAEAAGLLASCARALRFELASFEKVSGYLYLTLRCAGLDLLVRDLDAAILDAEPAGDRGRPVNAIFPFHQGFLLAGPDLAENLPEPGSVLTIPAERSFGAYDLTVICVRSHAPPDRWWDLVSWEEESCVPVKRNGRAAPGSAARRKPAPTGGGRAPDP